MFRPFLFSLHLSYFHLFTVHFLSIANLNCHFQPLFLCIPISNITSQFVGWDFFFSSVVRDTATCMYMTNHVQLASCNRLLMATQWNCGFCWIKFTYNVGTGGSCTGSLWFQLLSHIRSDCFISYLAMYQLCFFHHPNCFVLWIGQFDSESSLLPAWYCSQVP